MPGATISQSEFDTIPAAIEAFRNGEFLVVLDDPSRENEADLIIAAQHVTEDQMAFMIQHTSGLICAPISAARADALELPLMVPAKDSEDEKKTAYTISVDSADPSVTTGISAADRALACRALAAETPVKASLRRPGHVFPLRSREGGIRTRDGHTEAGTEFCRLAGLTEAAVISEIVNPGQEVAGKAVRTSSGMLRGQECIDFARKYGLKVVTIADLTEYVEKTEGKLPTNGA